MGALARVSGQSEATPPDFALHIHPVWVPLLLEIRALSASAKRGDNDFSQASTRRNSIPQMEYLQICVDSLNLWGNLSYADQ
jgi:hypothetical protein